jgi:hypothetical protein
VSSAPITLLALFGAGAAHAGTLWITAPGAPTPCGFDAVSDAVRARLPDTPLASGMGAGDADVQLIVEQRPEGWSLEVRAPGQPYLRRALPAPQDDCLALSEAAALMTYRYLESIQWTGGAPDVSRLPPPEPPSHWRPTVELQGGGGLGLTGLAPVGGFDVGARYAHWWVGVSGLYEGGGQVPLCSNATALCTSSSTQPLLLQQSSAFEATAGHGFDVGPGAVRLEVVAGAELFWGWVQESTAAGAPPVFHRATALDALPFAGLRTGYELALGQHWLVSVRVQARAHLGQSTFVVQAYTPSQLVTHLVDGDATLAVGYAFF